MKAMIKAFSLTVAAGTMLGLAACDRYGGHDRDHDGDHHDAAISEADANKVVDSTIATWGSMDGAKIDALYAPDVVGFDVSAPELSTDRANWTKLQAGFAAMKFDKIDATTRKIQILDDEDFILSSVSNATSTTGPVKALALRCTDVYRKQADGKFLIVNEHCSAVPKPAAA